MPTRPLNRIVQHLRRAVFQADETQATDEELLDRFIAAGDEAAFEMLVGRHGGMVFGVCRRVLGNVHDAEDAFQATFLVLVRKAAAIRPRQMVGNWLYGVAYQTAVRARSLAARRRVRERQVIAMPEREAMQADLWKDLQPVLDQELARLPDKYRVPIVLCDLEGKTRKEAARQLGWPEGSVSSRLARGRTLLAKRLARHDLLLSGGSLAALLAANSASGSQPAMLAVATGVATGLAPAELAAAGVISVKAAALAEGVLKAMLLTKLKTAMVLVVAIVAVAGAGGLFARGRATGKPNTGQTLQPIELSVRSRPEPARGAQPDNRAVNGVLPPIQTTPGQEIKDVRLELTKPAAVRGKVVDAQGQPVADCLVQARAADKLENRYYDPTTRTKEDGSFELRFIRAGEQIIVADPFAFPALAGSTRTVRLAAGQRFEGVELVATRKVP